MKHCVRLLVVLVVATACAPTTAAPRASDVPQTPRRGGRIVEGTFADAKTFAPFLANEQSSLTVSALVYDGLYRVDAKTGELRPNLGSWTVSGDGLIYRWRIEPGAIWSDGRPIVGEDYLTGVKAVAKSKKTSRAGLFQEIDGFDEYRAGTATAIKGIEIDLADPRVFTVRLKRVFCPALANVFGPSAGPLPTQVYGKYVNGAGPSRIDDAPENMAPPVASGPFVYHEWRQNDQIVLDRNDSYFRGQPYLDQYVLKVVADVTALAAQLRSGDITLGTIEPKDLDDIRKRETLRVYAFQDLSYNYIGWNTRSGGTPGLADKRVRQALAYGLDMNAVVQQVLYGQGVRVYQHHIVSSWASAEQSTLQLYQYDRRRAEDLLRSAGFTYGSDSYYQKDGKRLELTILANSGNKVRETLLQMAVEQYRLIGVKVNPRLVPFDAMVETLTTRSDDVAGWILGWRLGPEPDPYGIWHSSAIPDAKRSSAGYNFGAFSSAAIDRAIEEARTPTAGSGCDTAARKKSYEAFNRILNDEQPYDFGFSPTTLLVATRDLRGFDPGTYNTYAAAERWWLAR